MSKSELVKFLIFRTLGNFLVLFALFGIGMTFGASLFQEGLYRLDKMRGVTYSVAAESENQPQESDQPVTAAANVVEITPADKLFGIVIPKINANASIIPNVNPTNYEEYMAALQVGVAHASGSALPGSAGNVYLFAHSTDYAWNVGRYNAVFYLLKEVEVGDEVDIFYDSKRYIYIVEEKKIVDPSQVEFISNSLVGESRLTLQTCWPPGTAIKRLLVIAKLKTS